MGTAYTISDYRGTEGRDEGIQMLRGQSPIVGEGDCGRCVDNRRMFEGIRGLGVPNIRSGGRGRGFMGGGGD